MHLRFLTYAVRKIRLKKIRPAFSGGISRENTSFSMTSDEGCTFPFNMLLSVFLLIPVFSASSLIVDFFLCHDLFDLDVVGFINFCHCVPPFLKTYLLRKVIVTPASKRVNTFCVSFLILCIVLVAFCVSL